MSLACLAGLGGCLAGSFCVGKCASKLIATRLDRILEHVGPSALGGSKIEVEGLCINIGRHVSVNISEFKVCNTEPYKSQHLLVLRDVLATVDLGTLLKSRFQEVVIVAFCVNGCDLTHEKDGLTTSNVKKLLNDMSSEAAKEQIEQQEPDGKHIALLAKAQEAHGAASAVASNMTAGALVGGKQMAAAMQVRQRSFKEESRQRKVIIMRLSVEGIQLESTTTSQVAQGLPHAWVKLPPIRSERFSEEAGRSDVVGLVRCLVSKIVMAAMAHIMDVSTLLQDGSNAEQEEEASAWSEYCVVS